MRIVTLVENSTIHQDLYAEHGLSLYLEIGHRKILFDAGQSGHFADNAIKLGVDLAAVDTAVLSHGHYDHGNGLIRFLEENHTAKIYASSYAFEPHYNAENRDIGLNPSLKDSERFVYVDDYVDLGDGIALFSAISMSCMDPIDCYGLQVKRNRVSQPDDFCHEVYLVVQKGQRRICITGCAHRGILNIIRWIEPDVVIGGFHFKCLPADSDRLLHAAKFMAQKPRLYYTGHCTGTEQYEVLKRILTDQIHPLSTGTMIAL